MKKITNYKLHVTSYTSYLIPLFVFCFLFFCGCEKCKIKYPKNIKPIDWENYNDVYTVKWNYITVGSETKTKIEQDRDKDIMIYGWVSFPHAWNIGFGLNEFFDGNGTMCTIGIQSTIDSINNIVDYSLLEQVRTKLDTSDLTKKCFIKGRLSSQSFPGNGCSRIEPKIMITDINNIYFEE